MSETDVPLYSTGSTSADHVPASSSTPVAQQAVHIDKEHQLLLTITPGGTEDWRRIVANNYKPQIGQAFATLDEGIQFYYSYASACGFVPRLDSTKRFHDGTIYTKQIVCNKEGYKYCNKMVSISDDQKEATLIKPYDPKKTKITRVGCKARIKFAFKDSLYVVVVFHEGHNHRLCPLKNQEFQKNERNLTLFHKQTIIDHCKVNIGSTRSFRICKEYANGYSNIGATLTDFKNFGRDVKCFIGDKDAQMFVNRFEELRDTEKGFYFAYEVDTSESLCRIFWSDAQSRRNYSLFGDVMTFDPTYSTNRYNMVFTPFTGVDHHKKSVTFGAALLAREDEQSFIWVFTKFLEAMGNKEPHCVLTDQDPAIKNAFPSVFKTAIHRFCMWHIMQKLPDKVGQTVSKETDFVSRFCSVVWNSELEPLEFEDKWNEVIAEFNMEDHSWLSYLFSIRTSWIPAYYRDIPFGCLLRTTQRSESENSFFKRFENHRGTLVEFWMRYQSAMDQQRYTQKTLDRDSDHSLPQTLTPLKLESHAARVYTHTIFYEFQSEVTASTCSCSVGAYTKAICSETIDVVDAVLNKSYTVVYTPAVSDASCSCKLFERKGFICRHIIWVLSGKQIHKIPDKYILSRWMKNSVRIPIYDVHGKVVDDFDAKDVTHMEISKVWSEFYATISVLKTMPNNHISELADILKIFRGKLKPLTENLTKEQELEVLLGCSSSTNVTIRPPLQSKNKGSGKRLVSNKRQCIVKAEKPKRLCNNCKQMAHHDKRNCPHPFTDRRQQDALSASGASEGSLDSDSASEF